MHDFSSGFRFSEYERPPIDKGRPIIQVERDDCDVSEQLKLEISRLNGHVGWRAFSVPNLLEYDFECLLEFGPAVRPFRETSRIEHGCIVSEK